MIHSLFFALWPATFAYFTDLFKGIIGIDRLSCKRFNTTFSYPQINSVFRYFQLLSQFFYGVAFHIHIIGFCHKIFIKSIDISMKLLTKPNRIKYHVIRGNYNVV